MAASPKKLSPVSEIEIQASQIIERLEEAVEKAAEAVTLLEDSDETDPNFKEEDLGLRGKSWNMKQGFLQSKGKSVPQLIGLLEDLIVYETGDEVDEHEGKSVTTLSPLSNIAKLSVVIQSIATYANTLDRIHVNNLNNRIHNDTTRWITHLFRFYESQAFYHDEALEGLIRITRMLLHYKYPKYLEVGFECLTANPPVIYSTTFSSLVIVQHLCRQLGLSLSCVHVVPSVTDFALQQKMDFSSLEKMINADKASNKIPLLLLAEAGSAITGHVDDLLRLQDICRSHDIWLHVRGHSLATLATINTISVPSRVADSMSLLLGTWLGIPGLPIVTLYRQIQNTSGRGTAIARETTLPLIAGLVGDQFQKRLVSLPIWFALQALGRDEIQKRIKDAFEVTQILLEKISKYPCIRILSKKPIDVDSNSSKEPTNKTVTAPPLTFETISSIVVFQYVPVSQSTNEQFTSKVPHYYDKLNSWLGQILQRDVPQINVEICELEYAGSVLRVCPLEAIIPINHVDIEMFIGCLEQQLDILSATVRLKTIFHKTVEKNPLLQLVEMEGWAGLGGVRYVPQGICEVDTDECKQDLNKINAEIVNKLRAADAAFSLGEGNDGLVCVRFGMVTSDTDIEDLLTLVTNIGKDVEESSQYLNTMVEIVKKGIETATIDLQKENEERLWQEGILRQVPVFGTIVNWWSPKTKETGIKGRSLNLQAGIVESTENIYRYHMQLQQGASSPPGTKPPPQPLVQTSILTDSSSKHSRSSSHSSQLSQKSTEPKNVNQNPDNPVSDS